MSELQQLKDWYEALAKGDLATVLAPFDREIEWREAEGHPYQPTGDAWFGAEAIVGNLFAKLASEWEGFTVTPRMFNDAGSTIVVEGRYSGTFKATGKDLDAQFCHIWDVRDGRLCRFQQYTDTAQFQGVTAVSAVPEGSWF
jgi:ketosteroid isomerase-like protein